MITLMVLAALAGLLALYLYLEIYFTFWVVAALIDRFPLLGAAFVCGAAAWMAQLLFTQPSLIIVAMVASLFAWALALRYKTLRAQGA